MLGRENEESTEQQVARWDGILTGKLDVKVVDGPKDHVALLQPPWVAQIGEAINRALSAGAQPSGADQIHAKSTKIEFQR